MLGRTEERKSQLLHLEGILFLYGSAYLTTWGKVFAFGDNAFVVVNIILPAVFRPTMPSNAVIETVTRNISYWF